VDSQPYDPSRRFDNVTTLFGNHYRFVLDALPDLTFFVNQFTMPSVTSQPAGPRHNPFVRIPEVGDHLNFSEFNVAYAIDNNFKTYFSLYYWLKGYGFPNSYDDIADFNAARKRHIANPRPALREIQKTNATLTILQPDNDSAVAEVVFTDVFPTGLGDIAFETVGSEPSLLVNHATFAYTEFDIHLTTT
jgi:hypothetical protein